MIAQLWRKGRDFYASDFRIVSKSGLEYSGKDSSDVVEGENEPDPLHANFFALYCSALVADSNGVY